MMAIRLRNGRNQNVPSNLDEWLDKWEPKIAGYKRRRGRAVAGKASSALDELEFLLARTIEGQVSE